jgi:hypothetical protein
VRRPWARGPWGRRAAVAAAALLGLAGLTACGGSATSAAGGSSPPGPAPSGGPQPSVPPPDPGAAVPLAPDIGDRPASHVPLLPAPTSYDPCPAQAGAVAGEGPSTALPISIPALPPRPLPGPAAQFDPLPGDVPPAFAGTILRPLDTAAHPGRRPVVLLFHGIYGDQCQMWWLAQYLAGAGFVAVTVTSPTPATHDASYGVAIDAARSALAWVQDGSRDPFARVADAGDVGIAGWSEGSVVASVSQGLPGMQAVQAIVALDDLRGSILGDTGAPMTFCSPPVRAAVSPRVPALGFASDTTCDVEARDSGASIKLSGFDRWRAVGLASVELPLAGYSHYDYADTGPRLAPLAVLSRAWFDKWLLDQPGSLLPFVSCRLDGEPFPAALSSTYEAAAYLPSLGVDSRTWAAALAARCHQPAAEVGTQPIPGT